MGAVVTRYDITWYGAVKVPFSAAPFKLELGIPVMEYGMTVPGLRDE